MAPATAETRQQRRHRARQERKLQGLNRPLTKAEQRQRRNAFKRAKAQFAEVNKAVEAQFALGPMAVKLALMSLLALIGPYRSRGKGRGTPSRRYGNSSSHMPHQGLQERMRRLVGGFALTQRVAGMTKAMCVRDLHQRKRMPQRAADLVPA